MFLKEVRPKPCLYQCSKSHPLHNFFLDQSASGTLGFQFQNESEYTYPPLAHRSLLKILLMYMFADPFITQADN